MNNKTKLQKINETLEQLYNTLSKTTVIGAKDCAIAITLLERTRNKLELKVKQNEKLDN